MLNEKIYLILGIGTDIGKTHIIEELCKKYKSSKVIKPIATGFNIENKNSDSFRIQKAMEKNGLKYSIEEITPYSYRQENSPHLVSKINYEDVIKFCNKEIELAKKNNSFLFIESAGGVMTPINFNKTFLDLAKDIDINVLLISSNYLGAISHTLTAVNALVTKEINIESIYINEDLTKSQNFFKNYGDIELIDMINTIESFTNIPTLSINNIISTFK